MVWLKRDAKPSSITLADRARELGDWETAVQHYRTALTRNPNNPPIWVQYGHALKESGQLAAAEAAYRRALTAASEVADTSLQLGHVLKLQGRKAEAETAYLRAFALNPADPDALLELRRLGWPEAQTSELLKAATSTGSADGGAGAPLSISDLPQRPYQVSEHAQLSEVRKTAAFVPDAKRLGEVVSTTPLVSVLIPVHNKVELTRACLNSLFAHADPDIPTEIILIDDCSTDGTAEYLASLTARVRVSRNRVRGCFGHNLNAAAAIARGDYLVFLNNDTEVTPHWLRHMLDAVRLDPLIGVVGNRQLYPGSGNINHAGMVFDENCRPVHLYPDKPADFPAANISRDFQALTGACLLVPRAVFGELGGFDPQFRNGHEDVDFCLRAGQRGYRVHYVAESVIYHHIGSTTGRYDAEDANERYFLAKWRGKLRPDLHDYAVIDETLLPSHVKSPAVTTDVADLHLAIPLQFGNAFSWVATQLALACEEAGLRVSLLDGPIDSSIDAAAQSRLRRMMERPASRRAQIKWSHYWEPYADKEIEGQIKAEIFVTNYRYGPQPTHLLDRWMRHVVLNGNRKLPVSGYCRDALTELGVPVDRCRVVPHGYSPEALRDITTDERFRNFGFVFLALTNSHDPYRYGTDILLSAFTRAFAGRRDVVLVLKDYGGQQSGMVGGWVQQMPEFPKIVHVCEFVSKENLLALYRGADAFVAPYRGEGFGMKIIDAVAMGLPILAPHYGGPADYLRPDEFLPLEFREVPVGECLDRAETIIPAFATWAEVEVDSLVEQMQFAVGQNEALRQRAAKARERVLVDYSWRRVASTLISALGDFEREREATMAARRFPTPDANISVIIPTLNRPVELAKTLDAYDRQTLAKERWEIVISDDGSNYDVAAHVAPFAERFRMQVITSPVQTGAGEARNRAIPRARGALVLFGGDDIVPEPDFLAGHLEAHDKYGDPQTAVLGFTDWHSDLQVTRLMNYVTGDGGQQFAYKILPPYELIPYGYFYTSNVSVPRALLERQEELFSPRFPGAGFEDVELGLRLEQDGMRLRYVPDIVGKHLHAMSDESIIRRQYNIGRWLVTYAMLQPQRIGDRHKRILRWLEAFQHVLAKHPEFIAIGGDISTAAGAVASWLDGAARATAALEEASGRVCLKPALVAEETAPRQQLDRIFAQRLDLAEVDGIADAWFGIEAGAPNPGRDLLRTIFSRVG